MTTDPMKIAGHGTVLVLNADGTVDQRSEFHNLVTQVGVQYYVERAIGIASPPAQVTGAKLGTGSTAPSATGAGAALVTYLTNSHQAIDGGFPVSSLVTGTRRATWQATYPAGKGTSAVTLITEAVLVNTTLTDATSAAAATIARALLSPSVTKAADQILVLVWNHDFTAS